MSNPVCVTQEILDEIALSPEEYKAIIERLGREPNRLELGMFGALWSEHCGYKHTKPLIKMFADEAKDSGLALATRMENAGAVKINKDVAVVLKIESHNHPSAVEPYQGAATGIGGIVRDILAMGARPTALLNSLRFGNVSDDRQLRLLDGAASGIADYGNCIGVPNVGGEIVFDECYSGNPLVNAMCVGIVDPDNMLHARASGAGDALVIAGAKTGRDGIHGASGLASRAFEEEDEAKRSTVQVGDPFFEKCLIEACLEAAKIPQVAGMQDCGAAGITSAAVEMAEKSNLGLEIDVDAVPKRSRLSAYETMLSESQERMLIAVKPGFEDKVIALFRKWELHAERIGTFVEGGNVEIKKGGATVALLPVRLLTDPPLHEFDPPKPEKLTKMQALKPSSVEQSPEYSAEELLFKMLASPNIASKRAVYRQYDCQVQNNTVVPSGGDAAILRLKGYPQGIAISTDGNARFCQLDPRVGASIAVAEACRNLSATGATPIALTDGLNFGSPEKEEVKYQLRQCVLGIKDAATALGVPVVSGNASLYNETDFKPDNADADYRRGRNAKGRAKAGEHGF